MATVTSITAERAKQIEDASIVGAEMSGVNLILRTRGGSEINVGAIKSNALDAWPVGSIFTHSTPTSPATLLGGGTWARFGQGRVLVSQDSAKTLFDTEGETGGSEFIAVDAMPSHNHGGGTGSAGTHAHGGLVTDSGSHQHAVGTYTGDGGGNNTIRGNGLSYAASQESGAAGVHNHGINPDGDHAHSIPSQGGGVAHMPPYIVVYMWRRTA